MWKSGAARPSWSRIGDSDGDPADFRNFMGAVIDKAAFTRHSEAIEYAKRSPKAKVVAGGVTDDSVGWFVRPTVIETADP